MLLFVVFIIFGSVDTKVSFAETKEEEVQVSNELKMTLINLDANGDSTLIQYKDINILIDAGGLKRSGEKIYNKIKDLKKLDYVIFTHADSDHIINFGEDANLPLTKWLSEKEHYIDTFIDFDITKDRTVKVSNKSSLFTSNTYHSYKRYREKSISLKKIKNYYTASQCVWKERNVADPGNGAKSFFSFDEEGSNNGLRILYNYYYDHSFSNNKKPQACDRNLLSVCTLITVDDKKLLFTGDLEEFDSGSAKTDNNDDDKEVVYDDNENPKPYGRLYGESLLVAFNYEYLKDGVTFFKAAHHGSKTSNSANLMDIIRPKYVGISCLATKTKKDTNKALSYPHDIAINNMAKWTDKIYLTSYYKVESDKLTGAKNEIDELHGDIYYTYDCITKEEKFNYSSLNGSDSIYTDKWFIQNRFITFNVFTLGQMDGIFVKEASDKDIDDIRNDVLSIDGSLGQTKPEKLIEFYNHKSDSRDIRVINQVNKCTYIKIGSIDILIDCGGDGSDNENRPNNLKKIEKLCNDGVLDYFILTSYNRESYIDLIGENGLLTTDNKIKEIKNYIHYDISKIKLDDKNIEIFENAKLIKKSNNISHSKGKKQIEIDELSGNVSSASINLFGIDLLPYYANDVKENYSRVFSLMFNLTVKIGGQTFKYLNLGYISEDKIYGELLNEYSEELEDVSILELPNHGRGLASSTKSSNSEDTPVENANQKLLLDKVKSSIFLFNGIFDKNKEGEYYNKKRINNVYATLLGSGNNESGAVPRIDCSTNIINRVGFGDQSGNSRIVTYSTRSYYYFNENTGRNDYTLDYSQPNKMLLENVWN